MLKRRSRASGKPWRGHCMLRQYPVVYWCEGLGLKGNLLSSGVTGSKRLPRMSIGSDVCPGNGPGTRHFGLTL